METLREEEVLRLEEALLKKMEDRLTPLMEQAARDAARMAMQRLRLDMMAHISRHEETIHRAHSKIGTYSWLLRPIKTTTPSCCGIGSNDLGLFR